MILLAFAPLAGLCIGVMFFVGLWWTVQKAATSTQPGILFAGSLLSRAALALVAFYLVGKASSLRLVLCLVGFIVGRMLVKRLIHENSRMIEAQPRTGEAR